MCEENIEKIKRIMFLCVCKCVSLVLINLLSQPYVFNLGSFIHENEKKKILSIFFGKHLNVIMVRHECICRTRDTFRICL